MKGSFASDTTYSRSTGILVDHVETVLGTPDTFTNVKIQNNKVDGMLAGDKGDAIKALGNAVVTIQGNTIYAYGESGISAIGSEDFPSFLPVYHPTVTATSNIIYGGGSSRTSNFFGIGYWVGATGTADGNTIYNTPNNFGYALNSWTTMPVSFTHNIITTDGGGVGGYGAQLYQSSALIFSNNTIENQGLVGVTYLNPTLIISGNTITNSTDGFLINQQTSGSVRINGNSISGIAVGHHAVSVGGVALADSGTTFGTWDGPSTITVDATNNWWGNASGPTHASNVGGTGDAVSDSVTFTPWYTDPLLSHLKGVVTISIDSNEASTTIQIATTQSGLDSNGETVIAEIPEGTVATGNSSWDGSISAPVPPATPATVAISGFDTTVTSAFTVGSSLSDIIFDKAVRLVFAGQAGTHAGWYNHAGTFTEITADCAVTGGDVEASQTAQLGANASCKIDVGGNLIVWTKHFSTFVTYTQTAIPTPAPVSSGGGGGIVGSDFSFMNTVKPRLQTIYPDGRVVFLDVPLVTTAPSVGQVLGEATFRFTKGLGIGSRGDDVTELQNRLTAEGVYSGPITGYFGSLTAQGVKNFQKKYGISQVGLVGPQTRAKLNSVIVTAVHGCAVGNKFNTTTGQACPIQ